MHGVDEIYIKTTPTPPALSGLPQGICPRLGGHPPGLPRVPTIIRCICLPPALRDPYRPHSLLCGRLRSHGILGVLSSKYLYPAEAVCQAEVQRGQAGRQFLYPQDGAHPLAYEQGQRPHIQRADPLGWISFQTQKRGWVAGILVYPLDVHYPPLHQEVAQGPSRLCGHQKALPPWDGPPPLPVPSTGLIAPIPRPQLWRGRVCTNISHGKEARRLLAQGPEVDNQLLPQYPH